MSGIPDNGHYGFPGLVNEAFWTPLANREGSRAVMMKQPQVSVQLYWVVFVPNNGKFVFSLGLDNR